MFDNTIFNCPSCGQEVGATEIEVYTEGTKLIPLQFKCCQCNKVKPIMDWLAYAIIDDDAIVYVSNKIAGKK